MFFYVCPPSLQFRFPSVTADDFYFEIWEWDKNSPEEGYIKHDKFSKTIVAPGVKEQIYPDQNIQFAQFVNIDTSSSDYKYFQELFRTNYNSPILRSISYFFKTQFRNIAHFSELDDIVNYCSAFQTFLEIEYEPGFGIKIAVELANCFDVVDETKQRIKNWMENFYQIRSYYTHGNTVTYSELVYNNVRHIDIAFMAFRSLIMIQHDSYLKDLILAPVIEIFDSQQNFENLIALLSKSQAKEHIFNCDENELIRIRNLLYDIKLDTNTTYITYGDKKKLKGALNTILYIYGQLFKEYLAGDEREKEFYIEPLQQIKKILDSDMESDNMLDRLPTVYFEARELNQTRKEVHIREQIPLGHIFEAFGKILEVYRK